MPVREYFPFTLFQPFLVDVFNNLHGAVGKTAVVKILNALAERGEITVKTFGKSQLYVARQVNQKKPKKYSLIHLQDLLPVPSSEELNALDDEINQLKENLMKEKEAHRQVQAKLAMMNSSLPTEEVKARIASLEGEVGEMHARLEPLERGTVKIDPEERIRVEKQYALYLKSYKERKKLVILQGNSHFLYFSSVRKLWECCRNQWENVLQKSLKKWAWKLILHPFPLLIN